MKKGVGKLSKKIIYPKPLVSGDTIAVTAPSSGVEEHLHPRLYRSRQYVEQLGYRVIEGETLWTNDKCVSSSKEKRAHELVSFLENPDIHCILPPWGGEFLMEILPLLDWEAIKKYPPTWVLGYSDISTFLFAYTLHTGVATAHGLNYFDMGGNRLDEVSSRWIDVLGTQPGNTVQQTSAQLYQSAWDFSDPNAGFKLDTPTVWKLLGQTEPLIQETSFTGRLLGGCLDVLSILVGTEHAPVQSFVQEYCSDTGIIWYLESCEMSAADIYRHLWQMKQCGWFANTGGFLIGRPAGYSPRKNFELEDALSAALGDLNVPVIYDADIGHVPPQITLVNGALSTVSYHNGQGTLSMSFV